MPDFSLFKPNQIIKLPGEYNLSRVPVKLEHSKSLFIISPPIGYDEKAFLIKIAEALNCSAESDCQFIEVRKDQYCPFENLAQTDAHLFLLFGLLPSALNLQISLKKYQVISMADKKLLFADIPAEISNSKNLKMQLWNQLKNLKKS
nr:hypothetical protein [Saprospiraceae bacterium]